MHDFEHLRRWEFISDNELEKAHDDETAALLQRCIAALGDARQKQQRITSKNFVASVRAAIVLLDDGSNALTDAILDADECLRQDDIETARQIYRQFLSSCPSTFYRRIAGAQLSKIER